VEQDSKALEDFGYLMEQAVLFATAAGLGTCWLGGSFTKSSFAGKIAATSGETVPAVISVGNPPAGDPPAPRRLPADQLFFDGGFGRPLAPELVGSYAGPLEMVRLAPSASNKQPWRIIRAGDAWHFYLERTKGYGKGSFVYRLLGLADLQRVDMGIAMCHFALAARQLGLAGRWAIDDPEIAGPGDGTEYTASWRPTEEEGWGRKTFI
jgi:nitroreductase